ncbi:Retrotransposon protein [Seminavis robusta]|uniref:Retrotransposon protein n=1 Tax=Seminavis robusta TaxID=568900 RepID=A0A9N8EUJ1_9STRA|nr:Retrotransposon protein [Seminavis robusta]|eukprot:Sro1861_g302170.1 Retrotransposon protein (807) ;mRNA; f:4895-7389
MVTAIDAATFAVAITETCSTGLTLYAATSCLFGWARHDPGPPAYVPKRMRGTKPLKRWIRTKLKLAIKEAGRSVAQVATILSVMTCLADLAIHDAADHRESLDDDDDPDGPYNQAVKKSTRRTPITLWDAMVADLPPEPTKFELFLRFLNALKGGLEMSIREQSPVVAYQLVMMSLNGSFNHGTSDHQFDTDSVLIAIDNCSSRCITNCMLDFIDKPTAVKISVQGIGGSVMATYKGTVRWSIEDEQGKVHHFTIPNTYYNASTPYRLLSPQHWAAVADDNTPKRRGTWCATYQDAVELFWQQRKFKRIIPLSPTSNIAIVRSAPSFTKLHAFCSQVQETCKDQPIDESDLFSMPAVEVSDDEDSVSSDESDNNMPAARLHPDIPTEAMHQKELSEEFQKNMTRSFVMGKDLRGISQIPVVDHDYTEYKSPRADILAWHYRLGHISFERIRKLAERGALPAHLIKARAPQCASCMFGKATRRPWRTRTPPNKIQTPSANGSGDVVGVDQLISATPGFIGQMRGLLTRRRYTVSTVFVDHHSGLSYVHFQTSTSAEQTILAKRAFERYAASFGVKVKHYHGDNGIFDSKAFVQEVHRCGQTITYAAVNAHHMNGHAEKKIRDLQEAARTMILHAKQRWPNAVTANLWPFAIRYANDMANSTPILKKGDHATPLELFSGVDVEPKVKNTHTFGSPVYVLDARIQQGQRLSKWEHKARIGMYLGISPRHSRKVALILSLQTGLVSPQFHCQFDDLCDTLKRNSGNKLPPSKWQQKAGFEEDNDDEPSLSRRARTTTRFGTVSDGGTSAR